MMRSPPVRSSSSPPKHRYSTATTAPEALQIGDEMDSSM